MPIKNAIMMLILSLMCIGASAQDRYVFQSDVQAQRFQSLTHQIRCLVCQGQSVGDSDSYFSENMREWLHEAIVSGKSDYEIRAELIDRFGQKIFYEPSLSASTWLLWGLPIIFLLSGMFFYWRRSR